MKKLLILLMAILSFEVSAKITNHDNYFYTICSGELSGWIEEKNQNWGHEYLKPSGLIFKKINPKDTENTCKEGKISENREYPIYENRGVELYEACYSLRYPDYRKLWKEQFPDDPIPDKDWISKNARTCVEHWDKKTNSLNKVLCRKITNITFSPDGPFKDISTNRILESSNLSVAPFSYNVGKCSIL